MNTNKKFTKNDEKFTCLNCNKKVDNLTYSSRDHCTYCLVSIHIDINPGDRLNKCLGVLIPTGIEITNKKGIIINYRCSKCNALVNNISAKDDNYDTILKVSNKTYNYRDYNNSIIKD